MKIPQCVQSFIIKLLLDLLYKDHVLKFNSTGGGKPHPSHEYSLYVNELQMIGVTSDVSEESRTPEAAAGLRLILYRYVDLKLS